MSPSGRSGRAEFVHQMFDAIAGHYDLMNRLISLGRDRAWRRHVVRLASLGPGDRILDVGTGTGDILMTVQSCQRGVRMVGLDFTLNMMRVGRLRNGGRRILWCAGDALCLPFPDESFDAVTSAYLIRNVTDARRAFQEQMRVVRPGGKVVCLDTSPPRTGLLRPLVLFHLEVVIPFLGYLLTRQNAAYRYLPSSTRAFVPPEQLASIMQSAGLENVRYRSLMFGTQAVHVGTRR